MTRLKVVTVCCCLTAVSALLLHAPSRGAEEKQAPPAFSATEARQRVVEATGLSAKTIKSVSQRTVTDASAPFEIQDLPVWEVVFAGVKLGENRKISSLRVWVDGQSGALVKVFSPTPPEGGMRLMAGPGQREGLAASGVSFGPLPGVPKQPFVRVVTSPKSGHARALLPQVKEIAAYYGLFSSPQPTGTPVEDKPAWFVYLSGFKRPMSKPFGSPVPDPYATEMRTVLDAATRKCHMTEMAGPPVGKPDTGGKPRSR
jgi:hypothetical protein